MIIQLSNNILIKDIPQMFKGIIRENFIIENPEYINRQKLGRWTGNIQRYLSYSKTKPEGIFIPRGFLNQLIELCRDHYIQYEIIDQRKTLMEVSYSFKGELKPFQQAALNDVLSHEFGVLEAPTGSGKTIIALSIIAERRQPALIVVHTKELVDQWADRIETFLGIPRNEIGIIRAGQCNVGPRITIAIINSLYKVADQVAPKTGFLIVDECHRTPARTFTEAVSQFDCRYMLGLSATPFRRDGLSRVIYFFLGDRVHQVDREQLQESGDILKAEVVRKETSFKTGLDASEHYSEVLSELTRDPARNSLIASDIVRTTEKGQGISLVLTDRKTHCHDLFDLLQKRGIDASILTGDISTKERQGIVERLNQGYIKVLIATGQLIGEGFDCSSLSNLFITTPIKFNGRLLQYLGRVLRPAQGKEKAKVFDYVDIHVPVLAHSAQARERVYNG